MSEVKIKQSRTFVALVYMGFSYLTIVFVVVQGLVLVPLYLNHVSKELYGGWLGSGAILGYLSVLDLGFTAVIRQKVAEAYGADDLQRVAQIIGTGLVITAGLSIFIGLVGGSLSFVLPEWVHMTGDDVFILRKAILIAAIANAFSIFAYSLSGISIGLQRVVVVNVINIVSWSIGIGITIYALESGWGLISISLGFLTRSTLYLMGLIINLVILCGYKLRLRPLFQRSEIRTLGGLSGYVFLGQIADMSVMRMDDIIVAMMFGPALVTVFVLTRRALETLRTIPEQFGFAVLSTLAHFYGEKGITQTRQKAMEALSITVGTTAAIAAGIIGLNKPFVYLWVGSHLFGGLPLTIAMASYFFFGMVRDILSRLLFAIGEIRGFNTLKLIEVVLRIPLMIIFASWLGLVGLPLGALTASLGVNGLFLTRLFMRKMQITMNDFRTRLPGLLIYPFVAFAVGFGWMMLNEPSTWLQFILHGTLLGGGLISLLWLLNSDFRLIIVRVFKQVKRQYFKHVFHTIK